MQINKPIISIILLVAILALGFMFVWPKYEEFGRVDVDLAKKQAQYNGESIYYAKIDDTIKQLESRKTALDKISSSLPADSALAPIVGFFQQKAEETGLTVKSVSFSQTSVTTNQPAAANAPKTIKDILFSLNLLGNYQGLKNYLASLEDSARILEVDSITLMPLQSLQAAGAPGNKLETYDFKMQIRTHTY